MYIISFFSLSQGFVERIIKISQKLKSEKGFGFLIKGGTDQKTPITVQRIQLGKLFWKSLTFIPAIKWRAKKTIFSLKLLLF